MGTYLKSDIIMAKVKINWFELIRAVIAAVMGALGGGAATLVS